MVTLTEQEDATRVPRIFEMVEDSVLASHRGQDKKRGRERKFSTDLVFVPAWREATIRFAENLPMKLLIQEFDRLYPNLRPNKKIRVGESDQTVIVQKDGEAIYLPADILQNILLRLQPADLVTSRSISHDWDAVYDSKYFQREAIYLPADILQNILLRLQPADLVTSRSISHDWDAVYDSKYFQRTHHLREQCIVVNNHNLDIWGFSVISMRWFLMKVRCDWDTLGMKTLGVKASCSGLFLVARSDLTLFVVNPLTSECKSLPRIFPYYTRKRVQFLKSLIVHGTAEMRVDEEATGSYTVFLLGICEDNGNSFMHVATYNSTLKTWRVEKRNWVMGHHGPFSSANFPGPLRSFVDNNVIVCFSAASLALQRGRSRLPTGIEIPNFYGGGHINVTFPTMVPSNPGQRVLIGRLKGKSSVGGVYGRLPIVPHSDLGIWNFDGLTGQWNLVKVITVEFMQTMIESSEGTDFLAIGDSLDHIWLMLKGSKYMLQYTISTGNLQLQPSCPGGGYMDANFNWRAVFEDLRFNAAV